MHVFHHLTHYIICFRSEKSYQNRKSQRKKILHRFLLSQTPTKTSTRQWTSASAFCREPSRTKVSPRPLKLLLPVQLPRALRMDPWSWWSVTSTRSLQMPWGSGAGTRCPIFLRMHASMEPPSTRCSKWAGWTNCRLKGEFHCCLWLVDVIQDSALAMRC